MNTPKTPRRNTKEARSKANREAQRQLPYGSYAGGIHNERVSVAYATAISHWPYVEDDMVWVLQALISPISEPMPRPRDVAETIFHALIAQSTRMPVMRALLEQTIQNASQPKEMDEILDEFHALNTERNRFAHWYWITNMDTQATFICPTRQSFNDAFLDGTEVSAEELTSFHDRCRLLQDKISRTVGSRAYARTWLDKRGQQPR